jgi:ABC-2 type transport system ATP-binding protein
MITVSHLFYEYADKRALKNVSFVIPQGSVTALVGPNGAGKTTLLRCIAGLDEFFSGTIEVAGIDLAEEPRRAHRVLGYLSDFFGLYENLSVRQSLMFAAMLHLIPDAEMDGKATRVADLLELGPWLNHRVKSLSRGWRQRLGIAQAIIHNPPLLLLDEPAAGLDPEARIAISGLFRELQRQGMTIIVSSHILAELEDYCTAMLVLRDGEVIEHRQVAHTEQSAFSIRIGFAREPEKYQALLAGLPGVTAVVVDGNALRLGFAGDDTQRQELLAKLVEKGAPMTSFDSRTERLQDIYLSLSNKGKPPHA